MAYGDFESSANGQSRIAVHFPGGREFLWVTRDSPFLTWRVGQPVVFRSSSWLVLGRTESEDDASISYRLGVAA